VTEQIGRLKTVTEQPYLMRIEEFKG
jgi:hypothetical protein